MNKHPFQGLFEPFPAELFVISKEPVSVPGFAKEYVCVKFQAPCTLALCMRNCPLCKLISTNK